MTEQGLRKKAVNLLRSAGYEIWYPYKSFWKKEQDIFGIWDLIAWKEFEFRFIQLTTFNNRWARMRKVNSYMKKNKVYVNPPYTKGEVWAYHTVRKKFYIQDVL